MIKTSLFADQKARLDKPGDALQEMEQLGDFAGLVAKAAKEALIYLPFWPAHHRKPLIYMRQNVANQNKSALP
jgi:hypothetical protein